MHAARVAAVAGIALTTAAFAQSLQGLGNFDSGNQNPASYAYAISDDGQVVTGGSSSFVPPFSDFTGPGIFRWTQSTGMQLLRSAPNAIFGYGNAISANGDYLVGYAAQGQIYIGQAFRYSPSTGFTLLGGIPGPLYYSQAHDITPDGQIIVGASSTQTTQSTTRQTPYKWTQATGMVALPGLYNISEGWAAAISADGSVIVGISFPSSVGTVGVRAVRWTSAGISLLGQLPGGVPFHSSYATCVSHDGAVIAGYQTPAIGQPVHGFRWTEEQGVHAVGNPEDHFKVEDMNVDGSILVGTLDSASGVAAIWTESFGLETLNSYAANRGVDLTGWTLLTAMAITPDGFNIVGQGVNASGQSEAYLLRLPSIIVDCSSDFNGDGDFGTDADIEAFFACLAGSCCATCYPGGSDFNGDGDYGTDADIEAFFRVLVGNCW